MEVAMSLNVTKSFDAESSLNVTKSFDAESSLNVTKSLASCGNEELGPGSSLNVAMCTKSWDWSRARTCWDCSWKQ